MNTLNIERRVDRLMQGQRPQDEEAAVVIQQASSDPVFKETFSQHDETLDSILDRSRAAGGPIDLDRYEAESLSAIRSAHLEACYRLAETLGIEKKRILVQMALEAEG